MERLALIGVSHRRGGAEALEAWQQRFDDEALARLGFDAFVRIATCNRWEVVLQLPADLELDAARRLLTAPGHARPYAYRSEAAVEHLTQVAASLDALNPGEDQIMQQVREAYAAARARGGISGSLNFAFDTALRIAKRVRREVKLAPVNTSLLSLARPDLEAALAARSAAVVLGAGEMGTLAARILASFDGVQLTVVNRDVERARRLAGSVNASHRTLDRFLEHPDDARVLICATPVHHLVDATLLDRLPSLRLIIDLGIPRNVDPEAARSRDLEVLDVDSLQAAGRIRREALGDKLAVAEEIVLAELEQAMAAWNERRLAPSIRRLQLWIDETIEKTIAELNGDGEAVAISLPAEDRERLARRVAHVPIKGLRALAREYGFEAARVFLAETDLAE